MASVTADRLLLMNVPNFCHFGFHKLFCGEHLFLQCIRRKLHVKSKLQNLSFVNCHDSVAQDESFRSWLALCARRVVFIQLGRLLYKLDYSYH